MVENSYGVIIAEQNPESVFMRTAWGEGDPMGHLRERVLKGPVWLHRDLSKA